MKNKRKNCNLVIDDEGEVLEVKDWLA